ncbi:MAG TPA: flagellar hook-associated protein FlgK [Geminicoccus sp.]|jgi:flagellar hook-associated protein 1 FlgK|uniref:flagellar hook-associated protein FlgK n=1 Tax=Geminicoccus sp. TaxID=2024832 RepID=UPI002E327F85|nr:flagellar hook-associated protein FlgK [Geminicoccus sp.]HEX2525845.1 flagellar hook-associated protein FlgK [Geminicoccus sp.]
MSLTSTLNNALSGLAAAQNALANTANNVANVNTPGYSRKVIQQETRVIAGEGAGVRSLDVTRVADQFIATEAREQAVRLGRSEAIAAIHQRVQDTIYGEAGDSTRGIPSRLTELLTSLDALTATPELAASRHEVLSRIDDVLRTIDGDTSAIQTLRHDTDQTIGQTIASINVDLVELAAVNDQFTRGNGTAEMQDRRDNLLHALAGKIDIQVGWHEDGHVDLVTRAGTVLLDGEPKVLVYEPASSVASDASFGAITVVAARDIDRATGKPVAGARSEDLVSAGTRTVPTPELVAAGADPIVSRLRGGKLQGLVEARDRILPELADQLGELASMLRFSLNAAHNGGAANPPPATLQGTKVGQAAASPFTGTGTATIAVVDRTSGVTAAAFQLDLASFATVGDVTTAIVAASGGAVTATLDASGRLVLGAVDPAHGIAIDEGSSAVPVSDAAGHARSYGFSHYFGLNDLVVAGSGASAGHLRADIAANGFQLAAGKLDVTTGPPLVARLGGVGDQRGAAALAAALTTPTVTVARGALPAYAQTPGGYAADMASLSAALAAEAQRTEAGDKALADDLASRIGTIGGVNLDEELSRLVLYQQAYTVSARIISITDDLFGELLRIGN